MTTTSVQLWHRQENESPKAFEAFAAYRELKQRSLSKIAEKLGKHQSCLEAWSSKYDWVKRCAAWDNELDRQSQVAEIGAVKRMKKLQVTRAMRMQDVSADVFDDLWKQLQEAEDKSDVKIALDTAIKMMEAGAKLERLNRDEPDSIQQVNTTDYSKLTGDELERLKELMIKAGDNSE